jgi:hypothetical protein
MKHQALSKTVSTETDPLPSLERLGAVQNNPAFNGEVEKLFESLFQSLALSTDTWTKRS